MLTNLSIRDLVLIERVDLDFAPGLTVLTGETGAGKSILLDGLGLALGERADLAMIRKGAAQASATAEFRVAADHPAATHLDANDIASDSPGSIVLRRTLKADGGSRAHVNDQPVSATLLRQLGVLLVEVHGQHDDRGLINPRGHLALVDAFAGHAGLLGDMKLAFAGWRQASGAGAKARSEADAAARDQEWLVHAAGELQALKPQPGEERALADLRAGMQKGARLAECLDAVDALLTTGDGALARLRQAGRRLERIADADPDVQNALEAIDRALTEAGAAEAGLGRVRARFLLSPEALEEAEARLFALRAMARKHRVEVDELATLADQLSAKLAALESCGDQLTALAAAEDQARLQMEATAARLSESRREAASRLDAAVNAELPALKLDRARFRSRLQPVEPGETGADQLLFEVATSAGADFGSLTRIASGGEMSRFTLALKVALARTGAAQTLIFDEIDRGVGGATASAIGKRLALVAGGAQVLVVTHSPQVAAAGHAHIRISKGGSTTTAQLLDHADRTDEIARMLSGEAVTTEARAQAARLLAGPEAGSVVG